jgi:hypothetical protein
MRLYLNPPGLPRHWAASKSQNLTVRRSPRPDDLGRHAYIVHNHLKNGTVKRYVMRERWINDFLQRLCEVANIDTCGVLRDERQKEPLWVYPNDDADQLGLFDDSSAVLMQVRITTQEVAQMHEMFAEMKGSDWERYKVIGERFRCSPQTVYNHVRKQQKVAA